jgi:hypothetical protein
VISRLVAAVPDILGLVGYPREVTKEVVLLSLFRLIRVSVLDVGVAAETRLAISGSVCLANLILRNRPYKAFASRNEMLRHLERARICSYCLGP